MKRRERASDSFVIPKCMGDEGLEINRVHINRIGAQKKHNGFVLEKWKFIMKVHNKMGISVSEVHKIKKCVMEPVMKCVEKL